MVEIIPRVDAVLSVDISILKVMFNSKLDDASIPHHCQFHLDSLYSKYLLLKNLYPAYQDIS